MPAWNEVESIGRVLREIRSQYPDIDVLVVNDGSHDRTPVIAREEGALVLSHNGNQGYTAAIQSGRCFAWNKGYEIVLFADADGQHRAADIGRILDPLLKREADIVRGSRELGQYAWKEPFHLRIPRLICSILVSLKVRRWITDPTSGFKGEVRQVTEYFKDVYDKSPRLHLTNTNDIEECLLASKNRFRIMEMPVIMLSREVGETKCYSPRQLLKFPADLIRTFARNLW
ncbi:MAG: glycosyltransferase family 2 protein [Chloroflexi bacterium]|nr:glycosyltransferase family 2 protein [Chloroflexota bacterium]